MADCSKTAEFVREMVRMCQSFEVCGDGCQLYKAETQALRCAPNEYLDEGAIAIVQKWSDEHPVMTWESKLKELLPNVDMGKIIGTCCPYNLLGGKAPNMETCRSALECIYCWNGEYKEEP